MTLTSKHLYCKNFKNFFCILSLLFFFSLQTVLFPVTTLACSKAFQEITPEQLKARLSLIFENKKEDIQNLDINPSIPHVLIVNSKTGIQFQIIIDYSLTEPAIIFSPSSKILKIPSLAFLYDSSSDHLIKSWFIGHEIYSDINSSQKNQYIETQTTRTFRSNQRKKKPGRRSRKPPFEELIEILIRKNIFSKTEWQQQRPSDPDLQHIPEMLSRAYKEWGQKGGWKYVNEKAGRTYKPPGKRSRKPPFEELIEILIRKNIFSNTEWQQQWPSDPDLKHIPEMLPRAYKEWGQKGGWKYVHKQANKEKGENQETTEN